MAATDTSGGEGDLEQSACARDFVADRLAEADSPITPSELANEYDCSNGHIRNVLADLMEEGEAERVSRGQYVAAEGEPLVADSEAETEMHEDLGVPTEAPTSSEDEESDTDPSADGGPHSEDLDTQDEADQDGDESVEIEAGDAAAGAVIGAGGALPMLLTDEDGGVNWELVALLVVVALAAGWFWMQRQEQQNTEEEQEQQTQQRQQTPSGGLISGEVWE